MRLELYTAPSVEPVTTSTAKSFLKVDVSTDDTLIDTMITAARELVEQATGRRLVTQTWTGWLDTFPNDRSDEWWDGVREGYLGSLTSGSLCIPIGPVQSITHVKVYDNAGTATTADASTYYLATKGYGTADVVLKAGQTWPSIVQREQNAVEVRFVVGYGDAGSDVPSALVLAILNLVAHLYERRGDVSEGIPPTVMKLLSPYRNLTLG